MWLLSTITYTSSSTLEMLEVADVNGSCLVNALMTWASKVTPSQAEYLFVILPIVRCIGMNLLIITYFYLLFFFLNTSLRLDLYASIYFTAN